MNETLDDLNHDDAVKALCDCARTVTVLSYEEVIDGYFKLRGLPDPRLFDAQSGDAEAFDASVKRALSAASLQSSAVEGVGEVQAECRKLFYDEKWPFDAVILRAITTSPTRAETVEDQILARIKVAVNKTCDTEGCGWPECGCDPNIFAQDVIPRALSQTKGEKT